MTIDHYIVFIGAGGPLADELLKLERRIAKSRVIAPAVKRANVGLTDAAVELASSGLHKALSTETDPSVVARLYLWMFQPASAEQFDRVWKAFGHASWVETVPRRFVHNIVGSREHLEDRMNEIQRCVTRHIAIHPCAAEDIPAFVASPQFHFWDYPRIEDVLVQRPHRAPVVGENA